MGMNDDGLSPPRARGGARHRSCRHAAHQAGRRPPATQLVAAALALVLVGAVTGAAVSTAAILGGDGSGPVASPTATSTPTPMLAETPSPTPTPSSRPAEGIAPFADSCANALTVDEVTAAVGIEMALSDFRWRTGENRVLGGLDCFWTSAQEYASATVSLRVYPTGVVPETIDAHHRLLTGKRRVRLHRRGDRGGAVDVRAGARPGRIRAGHGCRSARAAVGCPKQSHRPPPSGRSIPHGGLVDHAHVRRSGRLTERHDGAAYEISDAIGVESLRGLM